MHRSNSEVVCLQLDVRGFHREEFTPSAGAAGPGRARLVHTDPDEAFDTVIELMAKDRAPFTARIGRTSDWGVRRPAFAGHRLVVLGAPAPKSDELLWNRQVQAALRRLATSSAVQR
jgi:hypothetical protein